jgi:hypothetical protein
MAGFSKALVLARRVVSLSTLPHAHGISDISDANCRIADMKVRIGARGILQEFNDAIRNLTRLCYFGDMTEPHAYYLPSAASQDLSDLCISLRSVLSRIPGLETIYFDTFGEEANTQSFLIHRNVIRGSLWLLRIDVHTLFTDKKSLRQILEGQRCRFPFLKGWSFIGAEHAWGKSLIKFVNVDNGGKDELSDQYLQGGGGRYEVAGHPSIDGSTDSFNVAERVSPLAGGYSKSTAYGIAPINSDIYPSEYSLHFIALFVLSSLVRYRPNTWVHAISRTSISDAPADDGALALIERFLEINLEMIPSFVIQVINPDEDRYSKGYLPI